ncbi:MAG TPA: cache domain-containing protein, partial [Spirochaetales bacterium]|nr:cache domain-containing protein [Spirochaetales bacterium]
MKFVTKHFYTVFVASMAILCAASAGTAFWAVRRAEGMNAALVQERIYEFKRTFLRDTVRNMIRDIDRLRDYNLRRAREDLDPLTDEAWADRETKATIADVIRAKSFEHDGYIWVNEVLDWSGGDGYAVRRVHPNLVDTEGCLLSTKATDIKGNTPYLTELEGVREHGELFYRYYFKRMGSDEVSEKLTYAALYPDYDWIVAMGMHVDDIETYTLAVREAASDFNARVIALVVVLLVLFFGLGVALLIVAGRRFMDAS